MNKFTLYLRKSTNQQPNSFNVQQSLCQTFSNNNKGTIIKIFKEEASGASDKRPILANAIDHAIKHNSILLSSTVCRLGRSVFTISRLSQTPNLRIAVAEFTSISHSNLLLNIRASVAQEERRVISERIKNTLDNLRSKGVSLGNPNIRDQSSIGGKRNADICRSFNKQIMEQIEAIRTCGYSSYSAISRRLNASGQRTLRGRMFSPQTVKNIIIQQSTH